MYIFTIVALIVLGWAGRKYYRMVFSANVIKPAVIYLRPGLNFEQVDSLLLARQIIQDDDAFRFTAKLMKYPGHIRAGKYTLTEGMSNRSMLNLLRTGSQTPVRLVINKKHTLDELADYLSPQFYFSRSAFIQSLYDTTLIHNLGFNEQTLIAMFLPNTYEVWWTTSPEDLLRRMKKEYDRYWNAERLSLANAEQLNPVEVITLASIVDEETAKNDEKATVAGLYLNRLRRNIPLQSDPTLKFAHQHFEWKRIYNRHKKIVSPYNTYMFSGLPPGPICIPQLSSIEAVLHAEKNDYIFMCAKEDFSGYHNFARTNAEHERNRQKYIRALNERGIK